MSAADLATSTRWSAGRGLGPEPRDGAVPHSSRLDGKEQRINDEAEEQGDDLSPCFCPRERITSADRPYGRSAC
jgi:hypothetical protein